MTTAQLTIKQLWEKLVTERSVTVILPADKLQILLVGLHKKRSGERKVLQELGEAEFLFAKQDAIRVVKDKQFIGDNGEVRATILIAPVQRQEYTVVSEGEAGEIDGTA